MEKKSPRPALTSAFQRLLHSLPLSLIQHFHFLPPSSLLYFLLIQRAFCYSLKASFFACVCVSVFSGWKPCWTHRSGFSGGRLRSQQRLIVRDPIVHGVRGHECVLCVAVCQCYHFLVFIVSQFFRKRTSCNPLLGR